MKIIIPMTGYGSRFVAQGYQELKPFIQVFGHRMIDWIVNGMYPNETDFLFVCRKEHLEDAAIGMEQKIREICPTATIFAVDHWVKKGPVYDVLRAGELIDDAQPCIINYCDFYMSWDHAAFCRDVAANGCDGAVPCYTGFHPNLLPKINFYASCKTDANGYLEEIREKYSFEADKAKAKHSPGVYYFKSGKIMKTYCQKLVESGQTINGEFYASLPYNFMVQDGLRVWVPTNVDYFCQWGTPEDLREMEWWVYNMISPPSVGAPAKTALQILLPMAGAGQRFADAGYTVHKPAIETTSWKDGR